MNPQRKQLSVSVSDMLEDHDYHLRLCHRDFICVGTGAHVLVSPSIYWKLRLLNGTRMPKKDGLFCHKSLFTFQIKKEEPAKSVTLPYTRPLPCLCIEVKSPPTLLVLST